MRTSSRWAFALSLLAFACAPPALTPPTAAAPAAEVALSGASVLIGAGDIARCESHGDEATATLVDSVLRADSAAGVHDEVFTAGDNAYPDGTAQDFALCFAPSWGDSAKLIMRHIRPSPGNHEHLSGGTSPYYQFFGSRAGAPTKGYYSYDIGSWHAVVLNSEMIVNPAAFSDADRTAQENWLRQDLSSHTQRCTVAYWHNPRFTSGWHGNDSRLQTFWRILYAGGADLVLNGHDHDYERFRPQAPDGALDTLRGVVEIVVGTGGGELRRFQTTIDPEPHSAYRLEGHYGVLKLTLGGAEWRSAFLGTDGRVYDEAAGRCH
ncbi:MAG TPA: metallophosphoesterase [Coriobacteriia bacterium]